MIMLLRKKGAALEDKNYENETKSERTLTSLTEILNFFFKLTTCAERGLIALRNFSPFTTKLCGKG